MKRVLVAMSGGVDSSFSICWLKNQGYDCTGATMMLGSKNDDGLKLAGQAAKYNGCGHVVFNFYSEFKNQVISRFVKQYELGYTPNPCVWCNRLFKFGRLLEYAMENNFNYLATGHYAIVEFSKSKNCFVLKRAVDVKKDQTYFLYFLRQHQLSKILFPLGKFTKKKIKQMAADACLESAKSPESQDICFVGNYGYVNFIKKFTQKTYCSGNFVDEQGKILGCHEGIINYTVGQRRGLGLSLKEPFYVKQIKSETNEVVLAPKDGLLVKKIGLKDVNLIFLDETTTSSIFVTVKLRYGLTEFKANIIFVKINEAVVSLEEPQVAPARGQAVVFYDGEFVVGGGTVDYCF